MRCSGRFLTSQSETQNWFVESSDLRSRMFLPHNLIIMARSSLRDRFESLLASSKERTESNDDLNTLLTDFRIPFASLLCVVLGSRGRSECWQWVHGSQTLHLGPSHGCVLSRGAIVQWIACPLYATTKREENGAAKSHRN